MNRKNFFIVNPKLKLVKNRLKKFKKRTLVFKKIITYKNYLYDTFNYELPIVTSLTNKTKFNLLKPFRYNSWYWLKVNWNRFILNVYLFIVYDISDTWYKKLKRYHHHAYSLNFYDTYKWNLSHYNKFLINSLIPIFLTYGLLFEKIFYERHFHFSNIHPSSYDAIMELTLNFRKNRLFVNLKDLKKRDYFSFTVGFFLKYFEKKKSLKKNKFMKFLSAKFLRKLFILLNISCANLIIKGVPLYLMEMLKLLHRPVKHLFYDPIEHNLINETKRNSAIFPIKFNYFFFLKNKMFGYVRLRQRGRIKRKLKKKLQKKNKVTE